MGLDEASVYLFDDLDYLYALRCIFGTKLCDVEAFVRSRYREDDPFIEVKIDVMGKLIEELELSIRTWCRNLSEYTFSYNRGSTFVLIQRRKDGKT